MNKAKINDARVKIKSKIFKLILCKILWEIF